MKRKAVTIITLLLGISAMSIAVIIQLLQTPSPVERICNNLLQGGVIANEADCVRNNRIPESLEVWFPTGKVDSDYVRTAMQGFELLDDIVIRCQLSESRTNCARLHFTITNRPLFLFDATCEFVFQDDVLIGVYWHD